MFWHDVFQGHDPTLTNIPGEDNPAAFHRGLDAPSTSPVDRFQCQPALVQLPREHQDLPYLVAIQLHPLEASSPRPRKLLAVSRENEPPPFNLSIQHRPALLNLNRNYTGVPILMHLSTLNPRMRLQVAFQHLFVEDEHKGRSGGCGRRDQDGPQRACQGLDPRSSSMPSRSSPAFEMSPAPRVSTRSPFLETFCNTAGMASCWGM